ncbi:hypothetical protein D6827_01595, partial [Candidatus Parcubacteria bacterium]
PDYSVCLDKIYSYKETMKNVTIMKNAGLDVVHIVHCNASNKQIDEAMRMSSFVGLGGIANLKRQEREDQIKRFFAVAEKHWPIKIHGFGISNEEALLNFPFYSVDSSSWKSWGRFGRSPAKRSDQLIKVVNEKRDLLDFAMIDGAKHYLKLEKKVTRIWEKRGVVWKN